jgi:hypothetical protein
VIVRRLQPGDDQQPAILLLQRFFREEGFDTADQVIADNAGKIVEIAACDRGRGRGCEHFSGIRNRIWLVGGNGRSRSLKKG